jgi:hypothetical protein
MIMAIEHIDAIARRRGRDVLYVTFTNGRVNDGRSAPRKPFDWDRSRVRTELIEWLTHHGIGWSPCAGVANLNSMEDYRGGLYVDLPIDVASGEFKAFENYVEFPDGTPRHPALKAYICTFAVAQRNLAHDAPEFWGQWASTF